MDISLDQLIIHKSEYDPVQILEPWIWMFKDSFNILLPTALGHLFLEKVDGTIWFLDTWSGDIDRVAESYEHFRHSIESDSTFQETFLMPHVVADFIQAGIVRESGRCFSPFVSPGIGGSLKPANFHSTPIRLHQVISSAEQRAIR